MKIRFLLLMMMSVIAVQSWGIVLRPGAIITPSAQVQDGETKIPAYTGYQFKIVSLEDRTVALYRCPDKGNVVIPGKIYYEDKTDPENPEGYVFTVTEVVYDNNIFTYKNEITSIEYSEGFKTLYGRAVYSLNNCTKLILPSTLDKWNTFPYAADYNSTKCLREISFSSPNARFEVKYTEEGCEYIIDKKDNNRLCCLFGCKPDGTSVKTITLPSDPNGVKSSHFCSFWLLGNAENIETIVLNPYMTEFGKTFNMNAFQPFKGYKLPEGTVANQIIHIYNPLNSKYGGMVVMGTALRDCPKGYVEGSWITNDEIADANKTDRPAHNMWDAEIESTEQLPITVITSAAFYNIPKIKSIKVGHGIKLDNNSLRKCIDVEKISFYKCSDISTAFAMENSKLTTLEALGCPLETDPHADKWIIDDNIVYSHDHKTLLFCPSNLTFTNGKYAVHSSCETIEQMAFEGNANLKDIDLGSVKTISRGFMGTGLTSLIIPKTVESIGNYSFYNITNLKEIIFEDAEPTTSDALSIQKKLVINDYVFGKCPAIESLTLPARLKSIGSYNFTESSKLTEIFVAAGSQLATYPKIGMIDKIQKVTFKSNPNVDAMCAITKFGDYAFADYTELTQLVGMPTTVTTLGKYCFAGTPKLTNLDISSGSGITNIDDHVFDQCGSKSISVPSGVTSIGSQAFKNCDNLTTVVLPAACTTCAHDAFQNCRNLTDIKVNDENTVFDDFGGVMMKRSATGEPDELYIFPYARANQGLALLPPTITKIGEKAFINNKNIQQIIIPAKVGSIGNQAFQGCTNLKDIYFLGAQSSLVNCDFSAQNGTKDEDFRFGPADGTVSPKAFLAANVNINYPANAASVYTAESNTYWHGKTTNPSSSTLNEDESVRESYYDLGDNGIYLLSSSLANESLVVPATLGGKSVSCIGDYCFENISSDVKEVIIKSPLTYVGAKAFPSTVKSVFLTDYSASAAPVLASDRFALGSTYSSFSGQNIYVPQSMVSKYTSTWTSCADKIAYQIPFKSDSSTPVINTRYGTFSREFDVDISDNNPTVEAASKPAVVAYAGYIETVTPESGTAYIRMRSVNCGAKDGTDGTYIPANTGVLLEANVAKTPTLNDQSPADFTYYKIGEKSVAAPTGNDNVMACVTETSRTISATETIDGTTYTNFVISQGKYWSLGSQSVTIPAHKSYLHVPSSSVNPVKSLKLIFDDTNEETGIEIVNGEIVMTNDNAPTYNLMGQHVSRNAKGIVIVNGRKVLRK